MAFSRTTPALIWRAFFVVALLGVGARSFAAVSRPATPPPLLQTGKPDPEEGRAALEQMRRLGIAGDYFFEFQLRVMPRRGQESVIRGRLWGSRNAIGAITRVSLQLPANGDRAAKERRLLIQNGRRSAVWRWEEGGDVEMLGVGSLFEPLVPGADLTAFDLQMPFLFWEEFSYEGVARFRGRPAHVLVIRPPAEFAAKYPALSGVRVHLDTQFNALVQTELLAAGEAVTKTLSVIDLKKIEEQWIVKTIDVRDESTRNKTRFSVVAAGLELDFSKVVFEPGQLETAVESPRAGRLVRIDP